MSLIYRRLWSKRLWKRLQSNSSWGRETRKWIWRTALQMTAMGEMKNPLPESTEKLVKEIMEEARRKLDE